MNTNSNNLDKQDDYDIIAEFFKYLFFWKYFVFSIIIFFV